MIGRVDARRFVGVLRLETERISGPVLAIVRALEFDFVAAASHYGEESVTIGNAERLKRGNGRVWKGRVAPDHKKQEHAGGIKEPEKQYRGEREFDAGQAAGPGAMPRRRGVLRGNEGDGNVLRRLRKLRLPKLRDEAGEETVIKKKDA